MLGAVITPTAPALSASALSCARTARQMGRYAAGREWVLDARKWRTGAGEREAA